MIVWNNTNAFIHMLIIISLLITVNPVAECRRASHERNIIENGTEHVRTARSNTDQVDRVAQGFTAAGDTIAGTGAAVALVPGGQIPGAVIGAVGGLTSIISRAADQSCREYGCHKGYCWAYCSIGSQWCYTTKSYSQSYKYVQCSGDGDCDGCWKCGGPCTV